MHCWLACFAVSCQSVRNQDTANMLGSALPNEAKWSYTRGDRKVRLLVPDGLRHRKYLIEGYTEISRRQNPLRGCRGEGG